jgi:hypothetical protein
VIQSLDLRENGFGFEPEVTAKLARARYRVFEVGISYSGRTYADGKKIGWKDSRQTGQLDAGSLAFGFQPAGAQ